MSYAFVCLHPCFAAVWKDQQDVRAKDLGLHQSGKNTLNLNHTPNKRCDIVCGLGFRVERKSISINNFRSFLFSTNVFAHTITKIICSLYHFYHFDIHKWLKKWQNKFKNLLCLSKMYIEYICICFVLKFCIAKLLKSRFYFVLVFAVFNLSLYKNTNRSERTGKFRPLQIPVLKCPPIN